MMQISELSDINEFLYPAHFHVEETVSKGLVIRRLLKEERVLQATALPFRSRGDSCKRIQINCSGDQTVIVELGYYNEEYGQDVDAVIRADDGLIQDNLLILENPRFRIVEQPEPLTDHREKVLNAWKEGIRLPKEEEEEGKRGFRHPQLGALHAIAAHWSLSKKPGMVVMPTGTGKTEVMVASAIDAAAERVLVIVPTDALRSQTSKKFESYGILKSINAIDDIPYPIVGKLSSTLTSDHLDDISGCNVLITTMNTIRLADDAAKRDFASLFSHIYIDEAHHTKATGWEKFQKVTGESYNLLLTATPFREDGKVVKGKIIYNYPLSEAQERGYFKSIKYIDVFEPDNDKADLRIAEKAVERLRSDLDKGYDHILMARTKSTDEADRLLNDIYKPRFTDLKPIVIHSKVAKKNDVLKSIVSGGHRIIICVDMLGEGFDLPQLKVAALHEVHKSIGITLQFIGRFAREGNDSIGEASFVANSAEDTVPDSLQGLYFENADWNALLSDLSYDNIDPRSRLSEIVENLNNIGLPPEDIDVSPLALRPKLGIQVFKTSSFNPQAYTTGFSKSQKLICVQHNPHDNLLVFIVNQDEYLEWTDSKDIKVNNWDLYIAYYNENQGLLFISSSKKESLDKLANSISDNPQQVIEEDVFKVFSGLKRIVLHNVGLSSKSKNVRYRMFAGLDVANAIDPVIQQTSLKSNITGVGYEDGRRISIGCSRKGKIWALKKGTLAEFTSWCDEVGHKLTAGNVTPNDFLKYALIPEIIQEFPSEKALMADWPDQLFESSHFSFSVTDSDGNSYPFDDCQIELEGWDSEESYVDFALLAGNSIRVVLRLAISPDGNEESKYSVVKTDGPDVFVDSSGRRTKASDFFNANPPLIRLEDGGQLSGNIYLKPREKPDTHFDVSQIDVIDWSGVDLKKESRWKNGVMQNDSVQKRFIDHALSTDVAFVVDDDGTGESADVVTINEADDFVIVELWHCKYSESPEPGNRVNDLYAVCGQAQKSAKWTWDIKRLIDHLIDRNVNRGDRPERMIKGTVKDLNILRKKSRVMQIDYHIGIVQPGLSKRGLKTEHLSILGSTDSFIRTITGNKLKVCASA